MHSSISSIAQNVIVETTNLGLGVVRNLQGENYIIAPKTIFNDFDKEAFIIGEDNLRSKAIRVNDFYNNEFVILKTNINKDLVYKNTINWNSEEIIDFTNGFTFKGILTSLNGDQSIINLPVLIKNVGEKYITISLEQNKTITKEMLGGVLKLNNVVVGMLIDRTEDGLLGDVVKINVLKEITNSFFDFLTKEEKELTRTQSAFDYVFQDFSCSSRNQCSYTAKSIFDFKDLIKINLSKFLRLHYGEDQNKLSGFIDLKTLINDPDYYDSFIYIPKRVGSSKMYYQYEFEDQSRSKIYEVSEVNSHTYMEGVGYEMKPIKSLKGFNPSLFVAPLNLSMVPASPANTKFVLYSYNSIDYFEKKPKINKRSLYSIFEIPPNPSSKKIYLKFVLSNDKILGPFEYVFKNWSLFEKENAKLKMLKLLDYSYFECFSIDKRPVIDYTIKDKKLISKNYAIQKAWDRTISSNKLAFARNSVFPSVVCVCKHNNTNEKIWEAVNNIKSGVDQNNLNDTFTVKKDIKESYSRYLNKTVTREKYIVWKKVFPGSPNSIFLQLEYFDGDSSPILRIPLKDQ